MGNDRLERTERWSLMMMLAVSRAWIALVGQMDGIV